MPDTRTDEPMTVEEFGRRLHTSRASAYRIVASGAVDRVAGRGHRTLITEAALQKYLTRHTRPARKDR